MSTVIKILSALTYPFLMPFYAFSVFYGMERQAYYYSVETSLYYYSFVFLLMVIIPLYVCYVFKKVDVFSSVSPVNIVSKFSVILVMLLANVFLYFLMRNENFSSHGVFAIFQLFIILSLICLIQFRRYILNPYALFCGGLSGFIILLGHITGADVFWPFCFSVFLFAVTAFVRMSIEKLPFNNIVSAYCVGILVGLVLMCFY